MIPLLSPGLQLRSSLLLRPPPARFSARYFGGFAGGCFS